MGRSLHQSDRSRSNVKSRLPLMRGVMCQYVCLGTRFLLKSSQNWAIDTVTLLKSLYPGKVIAAHRWLNSDSILVKSLFPDKHICALRAWTAIWFHIVPRSIILMGWVIDPYRLTLVNRFCSLVRSERTATTFPWCRLQTANPRWRRKCRSIYEPFHWQFWCRWMERSRRAVTASAMVRSVARSRQYDFQNY